LGRFVYEESARAEFEDRLLMHLQIVIGNKLRRGEPFYFTWVNDASTGGGRTTVWVHARASLVFKFHGSRTPQINRFWIEELLRTANTPSGLMVVPEPPDSPNGHLPDTA
jgi:hypothetical protein